MYQIIGHTPQRLHIRTSVAHTRLGQAIQAHRCLHFKGVSWNDECDLYEMTSGVKNIARLTLRDGPCRTSSGSALSTRTVPVECHTPPEWKIWFACHDERNTSKGAPQPASPPSNSLEDSGLNSAKPNSAKPQTLLFWSPQNRSRWEHGQLVVAHAAIPSQLSVQT